MKKQLFILHMLFLLFICIPSSAVRKAKNPNLTWTGASKSKTLEIYRKNITNLNNNIPKEFDLNKLLIFSADSKELLEKIFEKIPENKLIDLEFNRLTMTKKLWDCISKNANKINHLYIVNLNNDDFTLVWPDLLKNSNNDLKIGLYDDFNNKHLALQSLFTELADNNKLSNKNYTLNLTFNEETNIDLSPTENKISSVKKLKLGENFSLENIEKICKLFNTEKLKKIEVQKTEKEVDKFLEDIKKLKELCKILQELDELKIRSGSSYNLYKKADDSLDDALADESKKKRNIIIYRGCSPVPEGEQKEKEIEISADETPQKSFQLIKKIKGLGEILKKFGELKLRNILHHTDSTLNKGLEDEEQEVAEEQTDDEPEIEVIENENTNEQVNKKQKQAEVKQEQEQEEQKQKVAEEQEEDIIQINQKWLTKKAITYSALALGASYLTYRLLFAKSKQPAINLKKNLSDNPQKIFTFIPSQQKKQLAIDKLRNK